MCVCVFTVLRDLVHGTLSSVLLVSLLSSQCYGPCISVSVSPDTWRLSGWTAVTVIDTWDFWLLVTLKWHISRVLHDSPYIGGPLWICLTAVFRSCVNGPFALLGCYTACISTKLPTFRDNLSVPSPRVKESSTVWPMKMGLTGCPETSAGN